MATDVRDGSAERLQASETVLSLLRARLGLPATIRARPSLELLNATIQLAGHHGVASALAQGFRRTNPPDPEWGELLPFFAAAEAETAKRNATMLEAAAGLAALLDEASISAVFLKGAALLLDDAESRSWRIVSDLDILVPEGLLGHARMLLRRNGYREAEDLAGFDQGLHHHAPALYNEDLDVQVELHVRLMQDPAHAILGAEDLVSQAVAARHGSTTLLIPCPTHRMIHLIAHAQISDGAYGLRDIRLSNALEAAVLARRHPIDWVSVREAFARNGLRPQLMAFLSAVETLFEPAGTPAIQPDHNARAWARAALAGLDDPPQKGKRLARVALGYTRDLLRNPRRLLLLWETLRNPERRASFLRLNRRRIGHPAD